MLLEGHKEGVYSVALGKTFIVSGGEDSVVRVWSRKNGDEIAVLDHHTYIVWSVKLWLDCLVTASYDCTVCYLKIVEGSEWSCKIEQTVQGPWEWADALFLEENGEKLVVQDENVFELSVWDIKATKILSR